MNSNLQHSDDEQSLHHKHEHGAASSASRPHAQRKETRETSAGFNPHSYQDAAFTFNSANITFTVPSITISAPLTQADATGKEQTFHQEVCQSFEKFEERQEKLISDSYEKADNLLLTTASGILALSVTFIGTLFGKQPLTHRWEIFSGWGLLGFTIALVLASHFAARKSLLGSIELARARKDECLAGGKEEAKAATQRSSRYQKKQKRWKGLTEILNGVAALAFLGGLAMIVTFVITNMH